VVEGNADCRELITSITSSFPLIFVMKMTAKVAKLRLVVFDLDYTIWQPEMYQLNGSPRLIPIPNKKIISGKVLQEAQTNVMGQILVDGDQEPIRVFEGASHALQEINRLRQEGHDISAAVASRTDEPKWAHICLKHLQLSDGTTLHQCFEDRIVIDCMHDKQYHLKRLQGMTGIKYEEMCFFDNEHWNITCVQKLGVPSFFTPHGMTRSAWTAALKHFHMQDY
jgi:magnesium-dependent phosphatase 1